MWSDNESPIDLLGCSHLVSTVVEIVKNDALLPATIGVFGDWGSGKTTVLRMVEDELRDQKDVVVVSFNGWLFEGYGDAKSALMGTILDTIAARQGLTEQATGTIKRLLSRVNWMRLFGWGAKAAAGGAAAYAAGGLPALTAGAALHAGAAIASNAKDVDLDEVGKLYAQADEARRELREFRAEFAKLLADAQIERLVVTIDDLDRCLPETVIETLEAIKLFLFVPNTAFVLGADERLVKYAVRRRFPELPGEHAEVGRDYLEKLVQFPVRVPPLGRPEMETYINLLFARIGGLTHGKFDELRKCAIETATADNLLEVRVNLGIVKAVVGDVPKALEENLAIAERIAPVLAKGLNGNPRQCKRFLNMLLMRTAMARSRNIVLKQRVLAKLMLLEYLRPESFKKLAEVQAEQGGKPRELADAEHPPLEPTEDVELAQPKAATSRPVAAKPTLPPRPVPSKEHDTPTRRELPPWLSDSWVQEWLRSDPQLASEDLRPYIFFARDTLGPLGATVQRMSPAAQQLLTDLFQGSEAARNNTLKRAKSLAPVDAASVFEALADRARQEEDPSLETSAFARLCDWSEARPELFAQFVTFLATMPTASLPVTIVTRLERLSGTDQERLRQTKALVEAWAKGSAGALKNAATKRLEKLKG
ncbi:MAG: hypothetical protein HOW73_50270 [Polyangiaceae bacterium]|nr:hypothetical protein [Polyangiaceae bacterium]